MTRTTRTLVEIFGHSPLDISAEARKFWTLGACPFTMKSCTKFDHTRTICYGTCAVGNCGDEIIICPNRFYANSYRIIKDISLDTFGNIPFMLFDEYLNFTDNTECVVALGQNSGREVKIRNMSMDWVLAKISQGALVEYIGLEVQSIDITGNYRDAWYAARNKSTALHPSGHGLNWANVHKRLIPQIIRKGLVYSRSEFVNKGMFFIVPEVVYKKFEDILGDDMSEVPPNKNTLSVRTFKLGENRGLGTLRELELVRNFSVNLDELSTRFITGQNLPSGLSLDTKIRQLLAIT